MAAQASPREQARAVLMRARQQAARKAYARPMSSSSAAAPARRQAEPARTRDTSRPTRPASAGKPGPRLRLVGSLTADDAVAPAPPPPIEDPTDPRWVLALRVAEQLQGPILPPDRRERLLRLARVLGLSVFDANLIIAIVQDQARRGTLPGQCARAGEPQLRMVPLPDRPAWWSGLVAPSMRIPLLVAALVTLELLMLAWLF